MRISESLLTDFKQEVLNTRKVLEAVPADQLGWKPHEKSMSLGQLAGHVAETPGWLGAMLEDELDFGKIGEGYKPFVATDRAGLMEMFEKTASDFEQGLSGRDDSFMSTKWTLRMGDKVLMSSPRHEAIRSTAIHHLIHHRGQLTVYLRLLGVPVPPTYGPTADNPDFA